MKPFFLRTKILSTKGSFSPVLGAAIEFNLPSSTKVNLLFSDRLGKVCWTIIDDEYLAKGNYSKEIDFSQVPGGEYIYKFRTDNFEQTRELKLVK